MSSTESNRNLPLSQIIKSKTKVVDEPKKNSREDWRKAKELEEARKAGTAPAAVDEEGKDINPHIPQYISTAPWYCGTSRPTLKHQRLQDDKFKRFNKLNEQDVDCSTYAPKYQKGACENCGAMSHKKKECVERPRKIGAKYSNRKNVINEFTGRNSVLSYDAKRDRWSGYDPSEYSNVIEEFQKVEEAKCHLRDKKLNFDEDDEDKYVDEVDMPGTKVDSKQRITVRNLRIREDTANYLKNLDLNSAYYDPKSRSMRENPNPNKEDSYSGENFIKFTGDTRKHAKASLFAWEAYGKGVNVHLQAEPTKLEMLQKQFEKKKDQFETKIQSSILEKYGAEEHLDDALKTSLLAQTEHYIEYSRSGKVIKGHEKQAVKSKYEEDVYINNHISVWGSFWRGGQWGYKCCQSFVKNSYCFGDLGKEVNSEIVESTSSHGNIEEESVKKIKGVSKKKSRKYEWKEKDKLKEALDKEEKHNQIVDEIMKLDERKRPYNSIYENKKPTEEEMEAYYLTRKRQEDPMNQFL